MSRVTRSPPRQADWPSDTPYFDAMIALAVIATRTQRAAIGTAVLVLPLRHPSSWPKRRLPLTC